MDRGLAHEVEAAGPHRAGGLVEELVADGGSDGEPQPAVLQVRHRLGRIGDAGRIQQRARVQTAPGEAAKRVLDETGRNDATFHGGLCCKTDQSIWP